MTITRKVVEVTLSSGVTVYVTPLSPFAQAELVKRAEAEFPSIDPKPYERPIPDTLGLDGKPAMLDGKETQEWKTAQLAQMITQRECFYRLALLTCTELPPGTSEELKIAYAPVLENMHQAGVVNNAVSDYHLIQYIAVQSVEDRDLLNSVMNSRLPLTGGEIAAGLRIFRPHLPGQGFGGDHADARTPGVTEDDGVDGGQLDG